VALRDGANDVAGRVKLVSDAVALQFLDDDVINDLAEHHVTFIWS